MLSSVGEHETCMQTHGVCIHSECAGIGFCTFSGQKCPNYEENLLRRGSLLCQDQQNGLSKVVCLVKIYASFFKVNMNRLYDRRGWRKREVKHDIG